MTTLEEEIVHSPNLVSRINNLIIPETVDHEQVFRLLKHQSDHEQILLVTIACDDATTPAGLINEIVDEIDEITRSGFFIFTWLRYCRTLRDFTRFRGQLNNLKSDPQFLLSNHHHVIQEHLHRLVEINKVKYILILLQYFEEVSTEYQPYIAGLLHKFVKGNPAYLKIVSQQDLALFKKTADDEIGMQVNHDYKIIKL